MFVALKKTLMPLALILTGLQTACVTRGNDFSSDLGWIHKTKTTQAEVQRYLGDPYSVGNSGGVATWTYAFYNVRVFGDSATKELKFYWNSDSTVQDFSFNSSMPEDRRRLLLEPRK